MAPEHPPELVIFDSRFEDGKLRGDLHYVEVPVGERLRVRWDCEREPENFQSVGEGVAYVFKTDQLVVFPVSRDSIPDDLGSLRYRWSEGLNFGIPWVMFVLILPSGHTLLGAEPRPARAKVFKGRLALYWILRADDLGRTQVECTLQTFEGSALSKLVELNRFCSGENPPQDGSIQIEDRSPSISKRVFISYSADSQEHVERVREFATRLKLDGIDVRIDTDVDLDPPEGWPTYSQHQIEKADHVILVCTETYRRRFDGREQPDCGKGVTFEGRLIKQEIFDSPGRTEKFIPVIFDVEDVTHIPSMLRDRGRYDVGQDIDSAAALGYRALLRRLNLGKPIEGPNEPYTPTEQGDPPVRKKTSPVIVLIHGIRTEARWQKRIAPILSEEDEAVVYPVGYDRQNVFQFLLPGPTRRRAIAKILWRLDKAIDDNPGRELVIIAHSFGTYCLLEILKENPRIKPVRVLFCGSVVERNFRWDLLKQNPLIVNECGNRDIWPAFARSSTWGYGASGTFGFKTPGVVDRYHDVSHSGYFDETFVRKFWRTFAVDSKVVKAPYEKGMVEVPWWTSFLSCRWLWLPWLGWLALAMVGLIVVGLVYGPSLRSRLVTTQETEAPESESPTPDEGPIVSRSIAPGESLATSDIVGFERCKPRIQQMLKYALDLTTRNLSYKFGSADPANGGLDTSGFVYHVLSKNGIPDVPRDSSQQYLWVRKAGTFRSVTSAKDNGVELMDLQAGDLLYWASSSPYMIERDPPTVATMIYLGREKGTNLRVMVGVSDGGPYHGKPRYGVGVFDFTVTPGKSRRFIGYARIPSVSEN